MQVAIAKAKSGFAELIRLAEAGEKIVITRHGQPVAELRAAMPGVSRPLIGALAGQIKIADDFEGVDSEAITAMFEDGEIFPK